MAQMVEYRASEIVTPEINNFSVHIDSAKTVKYCQIA